jgi:hypothetical protein
VPNIQIVTTELHRCFTLFNEKVFNNELPEPAITIQTKGKRNVYGWCSAVEYWKSQDGEIKKFEINIAAEYLDRSSLEIMQTMLHEMVHLYDVIKGIKDCSRSGTFHNKRFKASAEQFGLCFNEPPSKKYGWGLPVLKPNMVELINTFNIDESIFIIARSVPVAIAKQLVSYKLECPSCGIKLRANKSGITVVCKECDIELVES